MDPNQFPIQEQSGRIAPVSVTFPGLYCTDSRPRARWYRLQGLPLVRSECGYPQCNSSFVITRGSAMPSSMDLPVRFSKAHKKRQQRQWNSLLHCVHAFYARQVKCLMIRPQRYMQKHHAKKTRNSIQIIPKDSNPKTRRPPKNHRYDHQRCSYPCTSARFCPIFSHSALSFFITAGA